MNNPVKTGKSYFLEFKCLKRLCIYYFGLGFFFSTKKGKMFMLEMMNDFINELCGKVGQNDELN